MIEELVQNNTPVNTEELSVEESKKIAENLEYQLPDNKINNMNIRVCDIAGFTPVPCGGTHVKSLSEIGTIKIESCKSKKDKTKISYIVF